MQEDREDLLVLMVDEEGNEHEFEILDTVEFEGNEYALLMRFHEDAPEECSEEDHEVLIMRSEGGELFFLQEADEFTRVVAYLESLV